MSDEFAQSSAGPAARPPARVLPGIAAGAGGGLIAGWALVVAGAGAWSVWLVAALAVACGAWGLLRFGLGRQARSAARDAELAGMSFRLDLALAASEVGVWDVDLVTDELRWDERARLLFGVAPRQGFFSEADWIAALHPEDRGRAVAAADAAVAGDGRFVSDYRVVHAGGEIRHLRDMAAAYRGPDGAHRLVGLVWDVTADVTRQEELELRRAEAEAATDAKSLFLATMSHEIRTPMTGVLGMLDLMLLEPLPERQRERAELARSSARNLLLILNDILDFSKIEANQMELRAQEFDPRELVREVVGLMAAGAAQKGLVLAQEADAGVPERLVSDATRLRQILANLVSNAVKFTEAGRIDVRLGWSAEAGELSLVVRDSGIGMGPEVQARLFEKFYQADTSLSRRQGGTGLGLAISRQLVERMGGRIGVQSAVGEGSIFTVVLPAAPVAEGGAVEAECTEPGVCDGALRVLVAEDNPTNQYLLRAFLEAAGHGVTTVEDGAQAVEAAAGGGFDVIIMDVQMPQMDGQSATRAIRALPGAGARVPIIALTANSLPRDRDACLEAGMTDYVVKPIDLERLRAALRRARAAGPMQVHDRGA